MSNPLSMFHDEDGSGDWSTTRVNAFIVIVAVCTTMLVLAFKGVNPAWPLIALGMSGVFAVPIKALCTYIAQWFSSSPGQRLMGMLMTKVMGTAATATSTTVTSSTETKG